MPERWERIVKARAVEVLVERRGRDVVADPEGTIEAEDDLEKGSVRLRDYYRYM